MRCIALRCAVLTNDLRFSVATKTRTSLFDGPMKRQNCALILQKVFWERLLTSLKGKSYSSHNWHRHNTNRSASMAWQLFTLLFVDCDSRVVAIRHYRLPVTNSEMVPSCSSRCPRQVPLLWVQCYRWAGDTCFDLRSDRFVVCKL